MPILEQLDTIIGYAFAMLLLATLSGALVEAIQTLCRSRTFALEHGIFGLIRDLGVKTEDAVGIAKEITSDPAVKGKLMDAEAIQREEFVLLLLRKAVSQPGGALATALQKLTPGDSAQLLLGIEKEIVKQEAADPMAPAYVARVKAMDAAGAGALAGRVFAWYDNMTRRVDDAVNFQGRAIGLVAAWLVCFLLVPVDSIGLLKRLDRDENFRKALVERAIEEVKKSPPVPPTPPTSGDGKGDDKQHPPQEAKVKPFEEVVKRVLDESDQARGLLGRVESPQLLSPGHILTWVMVSLGSAFWWSFLKRLVGLKSTFAEALDSERNYRETDQRRTTIP